MKLLAFIAGVACVIAFLVTAEIGWISGVLGWMTVVALLDRQKNER